MNGDKGSQEDRKLEEIVRNSGNTPAEEIVAKYRSARISNLKTLVESYVLVLALDKKIIRGIRSKIDKVSPDNNIEFPVEYSKSLSSVLDAILEEDYNRSVNDESRFFNEVNTGRRCKDYKEMAHTLMMMDDATFRSYVNEYKNDVANWVGTSLDDKQKAGMISLTRSKEEIIDILLGIPLVFLLNDKSMEISEISDYFRVPSVNIAESIEQQKAGKLEHYSLVAVSKAEYDRIIKMKASIGEDDLDMGSAMLRVNEMAYSKPPTAEFLEPMIAWMHQLEEQNPGDKKLGDLLPALRTILSVERKAGVIKHGKFRYEIQEAVTDEHIIKISYTQGNELRDEVDVMNHYSSKGVKVPPIIGCFNINIGKSATVSIFKKVPGKRLDKILEELNGQGTEESRAKKSRILRSFIDYMVLLQLARPDDRLIKNMHHKPTVNYETYTKEISSKFVGYSVASGAPIGLGTLTDDIWFVRDARSKILGTGQFSHFNLESSLYAPVARILGDAKPGLFTDRSLYNCFIKENDLYLLDFEAVRNSPYTFDLATAFGMRNLVSDDTAIEVTDERLIGGKVVYKKGELISEKEDNVYYFASEFNRRCGEQGSSELAISDYNSFLKEYYAANLHRSLVHFGTFTRLMTTLPKEEQGKNRARAIECLDNARSCARILQERFSASGEFSELYKLLTKVKGKV